MTVEKEWLNEERRKETPAADMPLLEREEEHLLTQRAQGAWQTILHCLEGHHRRIP